MTEENSDLDIKITIGCTSGVPGPVTTTTTVLAKIEMPGYKGVNMSAIDEFDSVVSDRIVDAIEGFEDIGRNFGNLEDKNREKLSSD